MRSLDVIILKQAEAAGRELAHAHNDNTTAGDQAVRDGAYAQAEERERLGGFYSKQGAAVERAFTKGWNKGKQEG